MRTRLVRAVWLALGLLITGAGRVAAQCRPPSESNDAQLLAFYSAPYVFSPFRTPEVVEAAGIVAGLELVPIPDPPRELRQAESCPIRQSQNSDLAPLFLRPRFTFGLARGLELEVGYTLPVEIGSAKPNVASAALSWTRRVQSAWFGGAPRIMVRGHGSVGRVRGAMTCPRSELQQSRPIEPCFGSRESRDSFEPNMFGLETAAAWETVITGLAGYAGVGVNWLRPRFGTGFTDLEGTVDSTRVFVDLTRFAVFTGVTWHAAPPFELSGQVYSVPEDVTTVRIAGAYKFR